MGTVAGKREKEGTLLCKVLLAGHLATMREILSFTAKGREKKTSNRVLSGMTISERDSPA